MPHAPAPALVGDRRWRTPRPPGVIQGFWALYRRELRRQSRTIAFSLIPQGLTAALLMAIFDLASPDGLSGQMPGMDVPVSLGAFIAPGLIAIAMLNIAFMSTAFTILHAKIDGYIDIELMAPLPAPARLLAHGLIGATMGLLVGIIVSAILLVAIDLPVTQPGQAILFAILGTWCISLFGIFAGLWAQKWDSLTAISTFIVTPLVFLSGAFAPVTGFDEPYAGMIANQPFHFVIDGLRGGLTGIHDTPVWLGALGLGLIAAIGAWIVGRLIRIGFNTIG